MNIPATELKRALKALSPVRTESYVIGDHGISAQDFDTWVVSESALSALGTFSINGKKLSQVVNRMSGTIELDKQEKFLGLKSAKASVQLEIQNVKPLKIPVVPDQRLTASLKEFKSAVSLASASASPNKSAAHGGVIQIRSIPLGLEDTTPTGYRVAGAENDRLTAVVVPSPLGYEFEFTLNLASCGLVQIMDGDSLEFGDSGTHVWFQTTGVKIFASKRIENKPEHKYPNYDGLFSIPPKLRFQLNPEEWLAALKTVEPLIDETLDQGAVGLQIKDSVVQFKTVNVGSTAQDEAAAEQIEPDPVFEPVSVVGLKINAKHLSSFLSKAANPSFMSLSDKNKPVKLESGNVTALVMPVLGKKETK